MTTTELILSIAIALFGAKELWNYLKHRHAGNTKIKLSRLDRDEKNIELLTAKYHAIEAKYKSLETNYMQLKAAFRVMSPLLKKMVEKEPEMKAAFDVLIEFMDEQKDE